jgi:small GTP-binding protein
MSHDVTKLKVCMLGSYAVGKTSIATRFVKNTFSPRYVTTVGVRIGRKDVMVGNRQAGLVVWDIYGEDEFQKVRDSYIRGAMGCLYVVDGTRSETLTAALGLRERVHLEVGPVPGFVLLNKSDLQADWELTTEEVENAFGGREVVLETSAKESVGVEEAFRALARKMLNAQCVSSPARS